ncbi:hypothetical protein JCM10207_002832 [Rhodosporidiobolus poonsookiae]
MFAFGLVCETVVAFCHVLGFAEQLQGPYKLSPRGWGLVLSVWGGVIPQWLEMGRKYGGWHLGATLGKVCRTMCNLWPWISIVVNLLPDRWKEKFLLAVVTLLQHITPAAVLTSGIFGPAQRAKALQIALMLTLPCLAAMSFLLGVVELAFYSTWLILVEVTWILVYYKLANTLFGPFRWTSFLTHMPASRHETLTATYFSKLSGHRPIQKRLNKLYSQIALPIPQARRLFTALDTPWRAMQGLATEDLHKYYEFCSARTVLDTAGLANVPPVLQRLVEKVFGALANAHLARPLRRQAFLPFLMSYPGYKFYARYGPPSDVGGQWSLDELRSATIKTFHLAAADECLVKTPSAGVANDYIPQLLYLHLRAVSTGDALAAVEEPLFEAILDVVLGWKAQKLELDRARRRIKQD